MGVGDTIGTGAGVGVGGLTGVGTGVATGVAIIVVVADGDAGNGVALTDLGEPLLVAVGESVPPPPHAAAPSATINDPSFTAPFISSL